LDRVPRASRDIRDLDEIADDTDANSLIFGSDDDDSLFSPPTSPTMGELDQQELLAGSLAPHSPPRRPPIYDPESGEEMKIPEMSDEEFNASFGEQLARTGQGVQVSQGSAETVAVVAGVGAGAAVVAGLGVGLKKLLDSDDNDIDTNVDMLQGEQTDQIAYHTQNATQATTQASSQAATQASSQAATQASSQAATQASSQAATQASSQAATQAAAQASTQAATQAAAMSSQ